MKKDKKSEEHPIPRWEMKRLAELAKKDPNIDLNLELSKLFYKYAIGISKKDY